jgi:hypothetical protein
MIVSFLSKIRKNNAPYKESIASKENTVGIISD